MNAVNQPSKTAELSRIVRGVNYFSFLRIILTSEQLITLKSTLWLFRGKENRCLLSDTKLRVLFTTDIK